MAKETNLSNSETVTTKIDKTESLEQRLKRIEAQDQLKRKNKVTNTTAATEIKTTSRNTKPQKRITTISKSSPEPNKITTPNDTKTITSKTTTVPSKTNQSAEGELKNNTPSTKPTPNKKTSTRSTNTNKTTFKPATKTGTKAATKEVKPKTKSTATSKSAPKRKSTNPKSQPSTNPKTSISKTTTTKTVTSNKVPPAKPSTKPTRKTINKKSSSTSTTKNKTSPQKPTTRKNTIKTTAKTKNVDTSTKELVINANSNKVKIALMEDNQLVELQSQETNNNFAVGDIFLGRIKRLMPGLNAAFVDIGHPKDAFLHYTDLGPKLSSLTSYTDDSMKGKLTTHKLDKFVIKPDILKTGKIDQVLNKKDAVLVQILKEPIGTKGPRLSCEINIPGRFLVLTPFNDVIAVSKKIANSEERKRLKMLIESIKPKNFGVIVRTAAEGKKVQDLHEELNLMMSKWEAIHQQLANTRPPLKLLSELDKASSILRDILNDSFNSIVVNDPELHLNVKNYLHSFAPKKINILNLYKGRKPIFDHYGVTKQIKSAFGKTVTMPSGAYLVIEHTEAMHVIDVNSGHKMAVSNQEDAVLNVNLESAKEIARQMRLRDMGGIVIIDFIDMRNKEHKQKLLTSMRQFMKKDRAQHTILPLSKFGLLQITRQRVRPEVKINTAEKCAACKGTGKITASILLMDAIERDLNFILQSRPKSKLILKVHPYIQAYIKKGLPSIQMKWLFKHYKWISILSDANYAMTAYTFYDGTNDEIRF